MPKLTLTCECGYLHALTEQEALELAGKRFRCPQCGKVKRLPASELPAGDAEPDPLQEIAALDASGAVEGPVAPIVANIQREMQGRQTAKRRPRGARKYPYLDWYIRSCRLLAMVTFVVFLLAGLAPIAIALPEQMTDGKSLSFSELRHAFILTVFTIPLAAASGFLLYMAQMALADFLSVVRDIEENTRGRGDEEQ